MEHGNVIFTRSSGWAFKKVSDEPKGVNYVKTRLLGGL